MAELGIASLFLKAMTPGTAFNVSSANRGGWQRNYIQKFISRKAGSRSDITNVAVVL